MSRSSSGATNVRLDASPLVRRFAQRIAEGAGRKPIADVACGSGRNAVLFAQLGCPVLCLDRDLARLRENIARLRRTNMRAACEKLSLHDLDLAKDAWPFDAEFLGAIINVHFLLPQLFSFYERSISAGGFLLLETVPGHGGNYLELPRAGALRLAFERAFELEFYRERKAGPPEFDAVTVHLLARRRKNP